MAKIYGDTIGDPAQAPQGITGDGTDPISLAEGFNVPAGKTGTVEGTLAITGAMTQSGTFESSGVTFSNPDSDAKLDFFASAIKNPTVSGYNTSPTVQVSYTRCGPMVMWTIAGASGGSDSTGTNIVINTSAVVPNAVWPDVAIQAFVVLTDHTAIKIGTAELATDGNITIRPFDGPFDATAGQTKSFSAFSIAFVNGAVAAAASC